MVDPTWQRIAGLHFQDDGTLGVVWLARDLMNDTVHVYDCALFRREVPAVIGEGISARGKWIPVAWHKDAQEMADSLLNRGINMLPEPSADSQAMAEVISREIWQRIRSSRLRVDTTAAEWMDEYRTHYFKDSKVPIEGHPLMAATRHAIEQLVYARAQSMPGSKKPNRPQVAII